MHAANGPARNTADCRFDFSLKTPHWSPPAKNCHWNQETKTWHRIETVFRESQLKDSIPWLSQNYKVLFIEIFCASVFPSKQMISLFWPWSSYIFSETWTFSWSSSKATTFHRILALQHIGSSAFLLWKLQAQLTLNSPHFIWKWIGKTEFGWGFLRAVILEITF